MYPWTWSEWYLLGKGIILPSWTFCHGNAYKVARATFIFQDWLPAMRLQCACNISKVMYLISILLSQITKHINQKLTGAGTYGISEKNKLLGSHLCQEGPLSPADFRALELWIQTFWDAVAPALSACYLQVIHAVFLAPPRDTDYCCLLYYSALLWVLVTCHVQGSWFGAAVSFELI